MDLIISPTNHVVTKNFLSDDELFTCIQKIHNGQWVFTGSSGVTARKFWYMELLDDSFFSDILFEKIKLLINKNNIKVSRIYANGQTYGLDSDYHRDGCDMTFLLYMSPIKHYNVESICGHTLFKFPNVDTILAIEPIQNTAVLFDGNTLHRGMAPSRDSNMLRISIAWKLDII